MENLRCTTCDKEFKYPCRLKRHLQTKQHQFHQSFQAKLATQAQDSMQQTTERVSPAPRSLRVIPLLDEMEENYQGRYNMTYQRHNLCG